jgi:cytochrome b6-f complex iron-sulfur subunit
MNKLTRRDFLRLISQAILSITGLLGLGMIVRFLNYSGPATSKHDFDIGPASNYPIGSRTILSDIPAVLYHTANGFIAISLICTHLGCTVAAQDSQFACPCHGSKFDQNGKVLHGPAEKPLNRLSVETTSNGNLIIHT